jgi:cell division protein ZipA
MDKELLRVVIVLIGLLVMIGMVLWHFFKLFRDKRSADDYYAEDEYDTEVDDYEEDGLEHAFDIFPLDNEVEGDGLLDDEDLKPAPKSAPQAVQPKVKNRTALPALIEFSIVARADEGFNGSALFDAFEGVGLKYGSVRVFERVDKNRLVDFAVASMIDPGTFPDSDLEQFYCPGIVFYMQPREVENPLAVFDDFMDTIDTLAIELDGVVWDNQRQPLTAETIAQFRQMLAR